MASPPSHPPQTLDPDVWRGAGTRCGDRSVGPLPRVRNPISETISLAADRTFLQLLVRNARALGRPALSEPTSLAPRVARRNRAGQRYRSGWPYGPWRKQHLDYMGDRAGPGPTGSVGVFAAALWLANRRSPHGSRHYSRSIPLLTGGIIRRTLRGLAFATPLRPRWRCGASTSQLLSPSVRPPGVLRRAPHAADV